ncbi:MAG TPA: hypothetical protein VK943_17165 [Arenibaculum sp.]|nr:hypothetical protein [Arenibaculum sp.]
MLAAQVYLWSHVALFAATLLSGMRRLHRRETLAQFGEDVLRLLLIFMFAGGGAVGAARYLV